MAITTLNNRAINRSDTAAANQLWTATSATATDFQAVSAGKILQVVSGVQSADTSISSTSLVDIPGMSQAITPTAASSKILINVNVALGWNNNYAGIQIQRDIAGGGYAAIAQGDADGSRSRGTFFFMMSEEDTVDINSITYLDSPSYSLTNAITYKLQAAITTGNTLYINRGNSDDTNDATRWRTISNIVLMEVGA